MKKIIFAALLSIGGLLLSGCDQEKKSKDRSEAQEMYEKICKLTQDYTNRLLDSPDSSSWATACTEYEEKLEKISFSYPPDTDLLLTEGQNDTIHSLMLAYIQVRDERIQRILHPIVEADTLENADSTGLAERAVDITQ